MASTAPSPNLASVGHISPPDIYIDLAVDCAVDCAVLSRVEVLALASFP